MNRFVMDASVTLAWVLNEEGIARDTGKRISEGSPAVPWLWRIEVANTLLVKERRGLIPNERVIEVAEFLDDLDIAITSEPEERRIADMVRFAGPHALSTYDALYLELAVEMELPLFTFDKKLRQVAAAVGVPLL